MCFGLFFDIDVLGEVIGFVIDYCKVVFGIIFGVFCGVCFNGEDFILVVIVVGVIVVVM